MSNNFTIETLLDKLIGSTEPAGESNHDSDALDRLDEVEKVLEWAVDRLYQCRRARNNYQHSMFILAKKSRQIAESYLEAFEELTEKSEREKENE